MIIISRRCWPFATGCWRGGLDYPHLFANRLNTGMATAVDLDGDGRRCGVGDAQGFGHFAGTDGLAILSKFPILSERVTDFSAVLWADLPGSLIEGLDLPPEINKVQRILQLDTGRCRSSLGARLR